MKKIAVLTSGGDAPGMNAAIRAVVRQGLYLGLEVYGVKRGFAGLIRDNGFFRMEMGSVAGIIHRGGTILHTARAPEFLEAKVQQQAAERLRRERIDGLVVIGGDGTFRGAQALEQWGIMTAAVPGTIDNDISGTDSTIGFDTAVNTVLEAMNRLRDTATSHERFFVVEVMGRRNGLIALQAGLAGGAEMILIPEIPYDLKEVCLKLSQGIERNKTHSIILVAEGAASAIAVGKEIEQMMGIEIRVTVLGHIQRGGSPTAVDRILASRMGAAAVKLLVEGQSGYMIGFRNGDIQPVSIAEAFTCPKTFPRELYDLAQVLSR